MAFKLVQQFLLAGLIDQCHQAFFNAHFSEFTVLDLNFRVDQCRADAVNVIFFHLICQ